MKWCKMDVEVVRDDIEKVLFTEEQIESKISELAKRISEDYKGRSVLLIGILRGATVFLADLARALSLPVEIDFMAVASYGSATKTSGVVRILKDLDEDIKGRHVLIVEDIVDTGLTLNYLMRNLKSRLPKSLELCVLLSKEHKKRAPLSIKYVGFQIPDKFVVGYGLDYDEKYRNLKSLCTIREHVYTNSDYQ